MRIVCVLIDHFAAAVSERQRPDLDGVPLVIGGYPHERKPVYDVSPAAAAYGIVPGMTLREASQRCPQAAFLPPAVAEYERTFATFLDALENFTPLVEPSGLGCAYLDLRYLAMPPGGELALAMELATAVEGVTGLAPQVGFARGMFAARIAAERAGPEQVRVLAPGAEDRLLHPLPVAVLPFGAETLRRLRLLGIDTVGAFAALSAEAAARQFGAEGATAHRLARGIDDRRPRPRQAARAVVEEREFDDPVDDEARLSLAVDHVIDQLLPRLQRDYLFCGRAEVGLRLAGGTARTLVANLREPSQDAGTIARYVKRAIVENVNGAGIVALQVVLADLGGVQGRQLSLFAPRQGRLERLAEAAARLKNRLGDSRMYRAVITDAGATLPERRFALMEYR